MILKKPQGDEPQRLEWSFAGDCPAESLHAHLEKVTMKKGFVKIPSLFPFVGLCTLIPIVPSELFELVYHSLLEHFPQ